jgi:trehalose/maltose hydrolase-like predicted phosphorylase
MKKIAILLALISFSIGIKSQQIFPAIPVLIYDDFSKISPTDYSDYRKLKQAGYTPTCISNGLIGLSPGPDPLIGTMNYLNRASTVVSGFIHNNEIREYEELATAPYPLGLDIDIDGTSLRSNPDRVQTLKQTLNMNNGELTTVINFNSSPNTDLKIEVVQFASRFVPSILCEKLTLTSNRDVTLDFSTHIDTLNSDAYEFGEQRRELTETTPIGVANIVDQVKVFKTNNGSKLGIALLLQREHGLVFKKVGIYEVHLKANVPYDIKFLASLVSDLYHPEPHLECIRLVRWAEMVGFDNLLSENRKIWKELWKSRVKITGASESEQRSLDAAFYYLQSNIHSSSRMGFPPFGMTQSWAYYGHNFWDMDLWTMIPTLLVQPNAAKAMVEYRYKGLQPAKDKAALFGYRGAQYPWEAARNGWEATPSWAETGWAEQHTIGPALAGWQYYLATADKIFLQEKVWPIMQEIANWLESRGEFTKRGFEFKYMMGHDEWISNVSNSSYFNLLAKRILLYTIDCANELKIQYPIFWIKMADNIFIPMNDSGTVVYHF